MLFYHAYGMENTSINSTALFSLFRSLNGCTTFVPDALVIPRQHENSL
jgi:hypothetical protein